MIANDTETYIQHDGLGRASGLTGPVEVLFRDGTVSFYPEASDLVGWDWDGSGTDIMGWNYVDVATGCNMPRPQL